MLFSYDLLAAYAEEVLDKYDLNAIITACKQHKITDPWDIREYIIEYSGAEVAAALDDLSLDEFMEYLKDRYGVRWEEIITYRMV